MTDGPGKRGYLLVADGSLTSITVQGRFDRPDAEVVKIIDSALHDAGLCGCGGPANSYVVCARTGRSHRHVPSMEADELEAARAWIASSSAVSLDQGGEGPREGTE